MGVLSHEPQLDEADIAVNSKDGGAPEDRLGRRLTIGLLISVLLNAIFWPLATQYVRMHRKAGPAPIELTRVVTPPRPQVKKRPPRKPVTPPKPKPRITRQAKVPPQAAHNRILLAPNASGPSDQTALPGGNASVGQVADGQNSGTGQTNTPPLAPQPTPIALSPQPTPTTQPTPAPTPSQQPAAPAGPTLDAQAAYQENPIIPDELRDDGFKASVHVKVDINSDGTFTPTLRTSSGNAQLDSLVLDALRKWKWKPALQSGKPVASAKYFRFDFEVGDT